MVFTPDIKFVNDETLNEFVVTVERKDIDDRDSDREDIEKRDKEDKDNLLNTKNIEKQGSKKRDEDRDEEDKERSRVVRIPYKQLSSVQKNIIQYCSIARTAKEIMDHVGYYNNTKNMSSLVKPLLELGFLEMTEPDKPNSKNQKYRKVRN